jgi:dienelactone hydrolase
MLDTIRSRSFTNVAIASSMAQFPVLIFSPGMGFMPLVYTPTLEEVASQGYIVVALSQPYSTSATVFPDGRVIKSTAEFGSRALSQISATATNEDEFAAVVNQIGDVWTGDIRFTLDQMERMNAEDPFLAGRLDLSRVGVFGHSMGGGAAVEALHDDQRFLAAINMDGTLVGDSAWEGINRPVMLMLSAEQASLTTDMLIQAGAAAENAEFIVARGEMTVQSVYENGAPGYLFVLDGSKHVTYTSGSALAGALAFGAPADAFGSIPAERANHIINAYIVSFFDQYLKGEPSPLLEGAVSAYPEVTVERS